jgi:hypothetical protein
VTAGVTKALLLAQSDEGGSLFAGPLLLYLVVILTACVVMFLVLHRETRTRRKAEEASPGPVDEDPQS